MKINTFYNSPLDGFLVIEIDETALVYNYVGYANAYGDWIVSRETKASGTFRYACICIDTSYTAATCFAARASLTYNYPSVTFANLAK